MSNFMPSPLSWKISSASGGTNCVEVAFVEDAVLVRDSKNREGAALRFPNASWREFIMAVKTHGQL
jgi:hypothetical protein